MKYGIIADIHGNLEALQSVLTVLKDSGVDEYICAGDIVGYGADPKACIRSVREVCQSIVAGNHEHAVVGLLDTNYFNPNADEAVNWTREQLDEEQQAFLKSLELTAKREDFFVVHATPFSPEKWSYITSTFDAYTNFRSFEERICFVGHSHVPVVYSIEIDSPRCHYSFDTEIPIVGERRYIINVGSVGQPRDGNPFASFAVYETSVPKVEIVRVKYDVGTAQKKIIDAGLPKGLAARLKTGV